MIDFAGPWEVFQDTMLNDSDENAFRLYTVAEIRDPIRTSGGMKVVPEHTFSDAPQPKIIVIPAQAGNTEAAREWLRRTTPQADVVMSVCTGAFLLASTGLLDGMPATTHHLFYDRFQERFPAVTLERGRRFVENEKLASAGGLTSGIDLALRVVERYFGRPAAERTADYMEYQGGGWRDASGSSNAAYADPQPADSRQE